MFLMKTMVSFLLILVYVAFFILSERKILGYMQLRKGPKKVGFLGLLQSFADLMKLVMQVKHYYFEYRSLFSLIGVYLLMMVSMKYCFLYSLKSMSYFSWYSMIIFLFVTSLSSYSVLSVGWGSKKKYSLFGSLRSSFGAVSYEASFMCIVLIMGILLKSYNFNDKITSFSLDSNIMVFWPFFLMWILCILCETNRTPFDYGESESDLVSGFNTEYCKVYFTCLFACEYMIIFMMCWLSSLMFFKGLFYKMGIMFFSFIFMWFRGTLPRMNYFKFIEFFWFFIILFISFFILMFMVL